MPTEIGVGPPVLTINQGSTFMVTHQGGGISADSEEGVFASDTRFLSHWAIYANGATWQRLTSAPTSYYSEQVHLTNRAFNTEDGPVPEGTLELTIGRSVGEGIHEDLDVTNYSLAPVRFMLEVALRCDFADLFEVKSHRFVRRGSIVSEWDKDDGHWSTAYANQDFTRRFVYKPYRSGSPARYANGRVSFEVELAPGASWHTCCNYILHLGDQVLEPLRNCEAAAGAPGHTREDELQRLWETGVTKMTTVNEDVYRLYRQSVED